LSDAQLDVSPLNHTCLRALLSGGFVPIVRPGAIVGVGAFEADPGVGAGVGGGITQPGFGVGGFGINSGINTGTGFGAAGIGTGIEVGRAGGGVSRAISITLDDAKDDYYKGYSLGGGTSSGSLRREETKSTRSEVSREEERAEESSGSGYNRAEESSGYDRVAAAGTTTTELGRTGEELLMAWSDDWTPQLLAAGPPAEG
jgi:hypothetical protein